MSYKSVTLNKEFVIDKIVTVHYFEYMSNFYFPGESHDFWEFLYVDKGEVNVIADNKNITLKKGDIIFHKPNEFHGLKANGRIAPNLVVMAFECNSKAMEFFNQKILTVREIERNLMAQIIIEAKNTFSSRLDDPNLQELTRLEEPFFASEQLVGLYLEELLIQLRRKYSIQKSQQPLIPANSMRKKSDNEIYNRIVSYLEARLNSHVSIEQICKDNLIGRSQLQKLFRERNNCGVIDFFSHTKINAAKQLIRDNYLNFTQISDTLGYTSIHYFSRQFKKITGMTPSEYSSSVKVLSEVSYNKED